MKCMSTQPIVAPSKTDDFMPLHGIDHVEFYVGNALQAASYWVRALGFKEVAYAGLETGVRDRASHVLAQGRIRIVLTGALVPDHEIGAHVAKHGDGVKVIALGVPDVDHAYREATTRGATRRRGAARRLRRPRHACAARRSRPTATRCTPSSTAASTRARSSPATRRATIDVRRRRPAGDRPHRRQRRARPHGRVGQVLRGRLRDARDAALLRRRHLDRVLRADVEGRHQRQRPREVPAQRAGRGQAQVADRRVPRVLRRRGRAAHRRGHARHRQVRGGAASRAASSSSTRPRPTTTRPRAASARSPRTSRTSSGSASSSTATTRATCCRSSPSRSATARRSSSRSSSATARAASATATSRRCSRPSSVNRRFAETCKAGHPMEPRARATGAARRRRRPVALRAGARSGRVPRRRHRRSASGARRRARAGRSRRRRRPDLRPGGLAGRGLRARPGADARHRPARRRPRQRVVEREDARDDPARSSTPSPATRCSRSPTPSTWTRSGSSRSRTPARRRSKASARCR